MESIRVFFFVAQWDFPMNEIFRFCFTFWKPQKKAKLELFEKMPFFWKFWKILTPLKTNIDTKNDGLQHVFPFNTWLCWVATFDSRGVKNPKLIFSLGVFHFGINILEDSLRTPEKWRDSVYLGGKSMDCFGVPIGCWVGVGFQEKLHKSRHHFTRKKTSYDKVGPPKKPVYK